MIASVSPQQRHVSRHKGNTYTGRIRRVRGWGCEGGDENGSGWEDVRVCRGTTSTCGSCESADELSPLITVGNVLTLWEEDKLTLHDWGAMIHDIPRGQLALE